MSNKIRMSVRGAIAMYLGEDAQEVERNRRYQPSRTPCPVYTADNEYLTAAPCTARPKSSPEYNWVLCPPSPWLEGTFWSIWKHQEPVGPDEGDRFSVY